MLGERSTAKLCLFYYRASTGTMEGSPVFKLMLEVDGEEVSNTWFVRFDDKYTVDLFGKQ